MKTTAPAARYQLRRNRSTVHIDGFNEATKGSDFNYALSPCGALSKGLYLDHGQSSDDAAEILEAARLDARVNGRKVCKNCEKAAERTIEAEAAEHIAEAAEEEDDHEDVDPELLASVMADIAMEIAMDGWSVNGPAAEVSEDVKARKIAQVAKAQAVPAAPVRITPTMRALAGIMDFGAGRGIHVRPSQAEFRARLGGITSKPVYRAMDTLRDLGWAEWADVEGEDRKRLFLTEAARPYLYDASVHQG